MVQVENHYLWIDDSKLNRTAEVMSSCFCFFLFGGGVVAVMYNSELALVRLMLAV